MGRADVDVANRGVDGGSRPRRPCYPRGNFSVMPGPHRGGHERSLGHGFPAGPLTFKGPVRPAFALALYGGVLTRLSRPLGSPDTFSGEWRPTQTAHLPMSRQSRLAPQLEVGGVSSTAPRPPERPLRSLPPTLRTPSCRATAGCSKAPQGLRFPTGVPRLFTGMSGSPASGRGQWGSR